MSKSLTLLTARQRSLLGFLAFLGPFSAGAQTLPTAVVQPHPVDLTLPVEAVVEAVSQATVAAQVTVDFARIGVTAKAATDALSREVLKCADGKLTVPLQPMRMRLVFIASAAANGIGSE